MTSHEEDAVKKPDNALREARVAVMGRRARLQALLFSGAVLGTSLLMLAGSDVKIPKVQGE